MKWIESLGGPLVLLPKSLVSEWGGADLEHPMEGDDYGRACAVPGYLAEIPVGTGVGLVLWGSPDRTTILETNSGWALVRWQYADSEAGMLECVHANIANAEVLEEIRHTGTDESYQLFDSVYPGNEIEETLELKLAPGVYRVSTRNHAESRTGFLAHLFEPA
ncbi:MAG TPA: hypothetical protein DCY13_17635 [Verrucomicrobiales bacterium]|nr:hypothetical protein [Verrucomicrobiales bacterium]